VIIAIDGPAGSGKSTVSKRVAKELNILYVDTGAMYRALTLKAIKKGLDLEDSAALVEMTKDTEIELVPGKKNALTVFLDGEDVTKEIRTPELTSKIRYIADVRGVRAEMVKMQRKLAAKGAVAVLEGRDIGTVVMPDADKKYYLDADTMERAARRYRELNEAGIKIDLSRIEEDVKNRDRSDMEREVGALKKAKDAIVIDTTSLTVDDVVARILSDVT